MKSLNWIKGLVLVCVAASSMTSARAEPVRLFAAASLQGPLDDVAEAWDGDVVISYGGSGAMARQVSQGAPADAVILANLDWANWLEDRGIGAETARSLLSNSLAVVAPHGAPRLSGVTTDTVLARLDGGRLAMGQHMSVPAGIYARAWLSGIDAWDLLQPHLAETENVRAALALVARGETPLGIVYASDAAASDDVSVVYHVPTEAHPTITYPGLSLTPLGSAFLDHVAAHIDIFVAAGFRAP